METYWQKLSKNVQNMWLSWIKTNYYKYEEVKKKVLM